MSATSTKLQKLVLLVTKLREVQKTYYQIPPHKIELKRRALTLARKAEREVDAWLKSNDFGQEELF